MSLLCVLLPKSADCQTPDIKARLDLPPAATAGSKAAVSVEMTLGATWHVNSKTPSEDYLIPTELALTASGGSFSPVKYPKHVEKSFAFAEKPLAVYEGTVRFGADLSIPKDAAGAIEIKGILSYQACNDQQCFPPAKIAVAGTVKVEGAKTAATPKAAPSTPASGNPTPSAAPVPAPAPVARDSNDEAAKGIERYQIRGVPTVLFLDPDGKEIPGTRLAGFESPDKFLARLDRVAAGGTTEKDSSDVGGMIARRGYLLTYLFIFVMGLALNLTPCVYPVIPITVGYFSLQAEKTVGSPSARRARTLLLALLYLLGMALTYSVLGVAAALSGGLFGSALQSPWALGTISVILVALSLSMFGFYEIQAPQSILRFAGSKSGAFGALVMGALVGFVAAPCIGPFVLGLLTYVAAKGSLLTGIAMFFVLALGLGLPYVFLAMTSASLPRAGAWMIGVKHVFGVLMLAVAGWFAKSLPGINAWRGGFWLPAAVLIAGGLWIALFEKEGRDRKGFVWILRLAGSAAILVGFLLVKPAPQGVELEWESYSEAAIASAVEGKKPVIIDFFADWCIPCKELEHRTFSDMKVAKRLEGYVRLKGNLTHAEIKAY